MNKQLSKYFPWLSGLIAALVAFFALSYFSLSSWSTIRESIIEEKSQVASRIANHIEQSIAEKSYLAKSLASYVRFNPQINQDAFKDFAKEVYAMAEREVLSVQLVKDSFITYNFPESPNKETEGVNIMELEEDRELVEKAILNREPMVIGPRVLIQQVQGMVYRVPIFLPDSNSQEENFWGFSSIVMDLEQIVDRTILDSIQEFALWSQNQSMTHKGYFYGDSNSINENSIVETINLPTDTWKFYLSYDQDVGEIDEMKQIVRIIIIIISLLFGFVIFQLHQSYTKVIELNRILKGKNRRISTQLEEKAVLIKEIHHRIKNHFQLISSLNNVLYAHEGNEEVKKVVEDVNQRLTSLAQAYDQISDKEDGKNNLRVYISELVNNLLIGVKPKIDVEMKIDDIELYIKRTVYIGVVINELITNSLKHAFKNQNDRRVRICIKGKEKHYELVYLDNGSGLPEDIFEKHANSTGVQLIQMFSAQLGGKVEQITKNNMSGFEIQFPMV